MVGKTDKAGFEFRSLVALKQQYSFDTILPVHDQNRFADLGEIDLPILHRYDLWRRDGGAGFRLWREFRAFRGSKCVAPFYSITPKSPGAFYSKA